MNRHKNRRLTGSSSLTMTVTVPGSSPGSLTLSAPSVATRTAAGKLTRLLEPVVQSLPVCVTPDERVRIHRPAVSPRRSRHGFLNVSAALLADTEIVEHIAEAHEDVTPQSVAADGRALRARQARPRDSRRTARPRDRRGVRNDGFGSDC
jgi:hypothetical protein